MNSSSFSSPDLQGLSRPLAATPDAQGHRCWKLDLPAGLYQVQVVADAGPYPVERLYYRMEEFGNEGVTTGPWDYKPLVGSPLVPSWWVWLDGRKLGLWVMARVSVEDLEAQIFRGRFAFRVHEGGSHELKLVPYDESANAAPWLTAVLEIDPVDRLEALPINPVSVRERLSIRQWREEKFWEECRRQLSPAWRARLEEALGWVLDNRRQSERDKAGRLKSWDDAGPIDMTACVAGWRLFNNTTARERALAQLEELISLPGWGRAREDIYGYDGDVVAVEPMRACLHAYFGLDLDPSLRERVREKLRYQGNRFISIAQLTRDYWGGSVMQGHGWRSILGFSECAVLLLGEIDEAREWLEWLIPRFRQSIAAMPRDGHHPGSSHGILCGYISALARLRQAWHEASGEDLYGSAPVLPVVDRLAAYVEELPGQATRLVASSLFLTQMAHRHPDSAAAFWLRQNLELTEPQLREGYFTFRWHAQALFETFLAYPAEPPEATPRPLLRGCDYFEDAGLVVVRDRASGLRLSFQCGPWIGYHAYTRSDNPCDRMCMQVGPGSFLLHVGGEAVIVHPDSNYALRSNTRNCLLINGKGQIGDIGYPMSLPSWPWRGERITLLRHDEAGGAFHARLDLAPLYPPEAGVIHYTRDFIVRPGTSLICRDHVLIEKAQPLEWRFQSTQETGICATGDLSCQIGSGVHLEAQSEALALRQQVAPTPVVFSYTGSGTRFLHTAFQSVEPVAQAHVDFVFQPSTPNQ